MINVRVREVFRSFGFPRELHAEYDGGFPAFSRSVLSGVFGSGSRRDSRKVQLSSQWGTLKHNGVRLKAVKGDLNMATFVNGLFYMAVDSV